MSTNQSSSHIKPNDLQKFIGANYSALKSHKVENLAGWQQTNFKLTGKGKNYILKAIKKTSVTDDSFQDAYTQVLDHLQKHSSAYPQNVLNNNKQALNVLKVQNDQYIVRVLSYLEGIFMGDVAKSNPQAINSQLFQNLGSFLGQHTKILSQFDHPGLHAVADEHEWSLNNFLQHKEKLKFIQDFHYRRLVHYYIVRFQEVALPLIQAKKLRKSVIQNDANEYNILLNAKDTSKIEGLIDFGDMMYTSTINELAIALAYAFIVSWQANQKITADQLVKVAVDVAGAYHKQFPLQELEIKVLAYLIAARVSTTILLAAKNRAEQPNNEYLFVSEQAAKRVLDRIIQINPLKIENDIRLVCGFTGLYPPKFDPKDYQQEITDRRTYMTKNMAILFKNPIRLHQGALQYIYDDRGDTYLDCVNNVITLGHSHPRYVEAVQRQIATISTNTRYLYPELVDYAKELTATFPKELDTVFYVNSGSEANDLALRLCRNYTKSEDILIVDQNYHGHVTSIIEISQVKWAGPGGNTSYTFCSLQKDGSREHKYNFIIGEGKKPYIHNIDYPNTYNGQFAGKPLEEQGRLFGELVIPKIQEMKEKRNTHPAAFIIESIMALGGYRPLPPNYLKTVYQHVRQAGGLCIADEVQTGFGRSGKYFWAFQDQGVIPDIVTIGKPMGNGFPVAAVVCKRAIADKFNNGMEYFNTFGGNHTAVHVARETLKVLQEEKLQEHCFEVGNYVQEQLRKLSKKHPMIGDVRGQGLFIGAEIITNAQMSPATKQVPVILEKLRDRRIILDKDGEFKNILKFKPPLPFTKEDADYFVSQLDEVLSEIQKEFNINIQPKL